MFSLYKIPQSTLEWGCHLIGTFLKIEIDLEKQQKTDELIIVYMITLRSEYQ